MLKIKKTLSILLVAVLMMGMSVSAFADESKSVTTNDSLMEEYDELISAMVKAASNVKVIGDRTIYIPVQSGRLNGTVTIKEEPVGEQKLEVGSRASHVYSKIPDGKRMLTTTFKADKILGGEMILKSYYTMKNNGRAIDVTGTGTAFSPPLGYTNGGVSSYIVTDKSDSFKTKGSYTMKLGSKIPLTIRVVNEAELLGQSTILLKYYREV